MKFLKKLVNFFLRRDRRDLVDTYIEAAERIESYENSYCCRAIEVTCLLRYSRGERIGINCGGLFNEYFKPNHVNESEVWWEHEDRESRLIALSLMATIAETEELKGY